MSSDSHQHRTAIAHGDIKMWLDQGVLMLKAVDSFGDPVELAEHEVDELINALRVLREHMEE